MLLAPGFLRCGPSYHGMFCRYRENPCRPLDQLLPISPLLRLNLDPDLARR
jgi:hypothetical protein